MANRTCSVEGCDKDVYQGQKMCGSHFMKWYRHGDPLWKMPPRYKDITGNVFGNLTVISRVDKGSWLCCCSCGRTLEVNTGDLNRGRTTSCGDGKIHHRDEHPSYGAVHLRLKTDLGPASNYRCVDCGMQAQHWSYNHDDPREMRSELGPYSADASHYSPRCVSCHKLFDLGTLTIDPRRITPNHHRGRGSDS